MISRYMTDEQRSQTGWIGVPKWALILGRALSPLLLLLTLGMLTSEGTMDERCRIEVIELHQFFEDWYGGKIERTDEAFRRFSDATEEGFEIISPNGGRMTREEILTRVRDAHGTNKDKGFRVWIENYQSRPLTDGSLLVTYEEWQEQEGQKRGRVSTAVFRQSSDAPNGVVWLHVHETWLSE